MNETSEREMRFKEDPRSTDEVIALALTKDVDADGDDYWNLIWILQARLPVILDKIKELASCANPASRDLAATVLGQNGLKDKVASQQCVSLLTSMLLKEQSSKVIVSIIFALEPVINFFAKLSVQCKHIRALRLGWETNERVIRVM
jgi:hypothetical protein